MNLDEAIMKFKEYVKGENGFDELDFKEAVIEWFNDTNKVEHWSIETLIERAGRDLRSISWHSDGRVIVKSGAGAREPRKNYSAKTPQKALMKLISAK